MMLFYISHTCNNSVLYDFSGSSQQTITDVFSQWNVSLLACLANIVSTIKVWSIQQCIRTGISKCKDLLCVSVLFYFMICVLLYFPYDNLQRKATLILTIHAIFYHSCVHNKCPTTFMYLMKNSTTYLIWHHNVTICLLDLEIFTGRVIILSLMLIYRVNHQSLSIMFVPVMAKLAAIFIMTDLQQL